MKKKVSIIICVYNEALTVEYVLRKCYEYNPGSEIIIVDDGSTDGSEEILSGLNDEISFRYIRLHENMGKSNAMVVGVEHASNEVILFFDADVSGIRKKHFNQLLDPLIYDVARADMVLGSPSETLIDYRINPFKSLTGERSLFKRDIEPILEKIRNIRFGVETFINLYYQAHGRKIKYTLLHGLTHPTKYGKTDPLQATKEFISEGREIAITLLKNYDLITKSISYSLDEHGNKIKRSLKRFHDELNDRIQVLLKNNG